MSKIADAKLLSVSFHNNLVARYYINNSWCQTVTNTALFAGWKTCIYFLCLITPEARSCTAQHRAMHGGAGHPSQTSRASRKRLGSTSRQVAVAVGGVFWLGLRGFSLWDSYRKTRIFAGFPSNQYQKMRGQPPHLLVLV